MFKVGDLVERCFNSGAHMSIGSKHTVDKVNGNDIHLKGLAGYWSACNFKLDESFKVGDIVIRHESSAVLLVDKPYVVESVHGVMIKVDGSDELFNSKCFHLMELEDHQVFKDLNVNEQVALTVARLTGKRVQYLHKGNWRNLSLDFNSMVFHNDTVYRINDNKPEIDKIKAEIKSLSDKLAELEK